MTYPGVPCIYYGDEIGLPARHDARTRHAGREADTHACMPWDEAAWDQDLREFYRRLIALRRTSPALIEGGFQMLAVEEDTLAYLHDTNDEQIVVVAHRGPGVCARPTAARGARRHPRWG